MIPVPDIINKFEDIFLEKYKTTILPEHRTALQAMKRCRKEHGPHMLVGCTNHKCGQPGIHPSFLRSQELSPVSES